MRSVILGLGISGKAAADFLCKRGDQVLGVDRTVVSHAQIPVISDASPVQLEGVDLVVKSPGIASTHPWIAAAEQRGIPVIGEIDLAFAELKKKEKTVYGITGSNGKTTTTLLTTHLLQTAGKKVCAAGNVGTPLLTALESDADVFVVELSSFQLENIVENHLLDGAVILNITANHLDRHPTFEAYKQAKLRISCCLKEEALLFVSEEVRKNTPHLPHPHRIFNSLVETILPLGYRDSSFSLFPHDLENLSAAFALTGVTRDVLEKGVTTFVRPPHRLECVGEIKGITFINDSKATSVDAVIKAVQAMQRPIVLIAGGVDKGGAFRDWLPYFQKKVKKIFALGEAAARIEQELTPEMCVERVVSLEEGVQKAAKCATQGEAVLLSPGCSSYDMFNDYQQRGEVFRKAVEEIRVYLENR